MGAGLLQVRTLDFVPVEQLLLHLVQCDQAAHLPGMGQGALVHDVISNTSPEQFLPQNCGEGLLQVLLRILVPFAHVLLQSLHDDQVVHPPWIGHGPRSQYLRSEELPEQLWPPC